MRTAVIRVNLDPAGDLAADRLARVVQALRGSGIEVLAPDFGQVPAHAREIELLVEGDDPPALRAWAEARCAEALDSEALDSGARGAPGPRAGAATFLSRGTDEDALGVVLAFGISARLDRFWADDEEIAVFTITRDDATHVAESRLARPWRPPSTARCGSSSTGHPRTPAHLSLEPAHLSLQTPPETPRETSLEMEASDSCQH